MNLSSDQTEKNYTVFGEETEFYGVLKFTDNLEIAGTFEGTIDATGNLEFATLIIVCRFLWLVVQKDQIILINVNRY